MTQQAVEIPKFVKGYQGDNCRELSLQHGGPLWSECNCGAGIDSIYTNSAGRGYCTMCGKFVAKCADISCFPCQENTTDGEGDEVIPTGLVQFRNGFIDTLEQYFNYPYREPGELLFWVF